MQNQVQQDQQQIVFQEICEDLIERNSNYCQAPEDIEKVNLKSQNIKKINEILQKYKKIKSINLAYNYIEDVENLAGLQLLENLNLNNNSINDPQPLRNNKILQILNLNFNEVDLISKIPFLKNLQVLLLDNNKISSLQNMEALRELKQLSLANNLIKQINFLPSLPKLVELNLSGNKIQNLSVKIFENLKSIQILNLGGNKFSNIDFLQPLQDTLEKLDISNNKIEILSDKKLKFMVLDQLNVSKNQINTLLDFDLMFPSLFNLDISHNDIFILEDLEYLEYIDSLVEINVEGNVCCQNQKEFFNYIQDKLPFLQIVNGKELNKPGFRSKIVMYEMSEHMKKNEERYLQSKIQIKDDDDEQEQNAEQENDLRSDEQIDYRKIIQDYQENNMQYEDIDNELNSIKYNLKKQQVKNEFNYSQPNSIKEFDNEEEFSDFMKQYDIQMNAIRMKYKVQHDFNRQIEKQEKRQKLEQNGLQGINEEEEKDDDAFNQQLKQDQYEFKNYKEKYENSPEKQIDKSNEINANGNSLMNTLNSEQLFEQLMQDPKKKDEVLKLQKQLEKEYIKPSQLEQIRNNDKNIIIKKKIVSYYSQLNSQYKNGQFSGISNNNSQMSDRSFGVLKNLNSSMKKNSFSKTQNSVFDDINQVKKQMKDPDFMKSIGSTSKSKQTYDSEQFGNLGILNSQEHESGLMGKAVLKPKLPFSSNQKNQQNQISQKFSKTQTLNKNSSGLSLQQKQDIISQRLEQGSASRQQRLGSANQKKQSLRPIPGSRGNQIQTPNKSKRSGSVQKNTQNQIIKDQEYNQQNKNNGNLLATFQNQNELEQQRFGKVMQDDEFKKQIKSAMNSNKNNKFDNSTSKTKTKLLTALKYN